ncbi:very long chain fatty acid elongase 6-like [Clavelina lepadiformis]|uniref:very long chain fatty acid elongase 6-like n=1 Tax=Clavelina lepadiformis TaxID=159417 RepID=UPI0040416510
MQDFEAWEEKLSNGSLNDWKLEKYRIEIWMSSLYQTWEIPIICSVAYLVVIFGGQKYMKNRSSFSLRKPMMIWSSLLAVFSILGAVRTSAVMVIAFQTGGLTTVVCDPIVYNGPVTHFWAALFPFSKFIEYIDTVFIVLRKQNLIFLHWYHHLTVALVAGLTYGGKYGGGWVFMTVNYAIHSLMYSYYAFRAAGIKLPRSLALAITGCQIAQMIIGCAVMYGIVVWGDEYGCPSSPVHKISGSVMYASYLALFANFFYKTYVVGKKAKQGQQNFQKGLEVKEHFQIMPNNGKTNIKSLRKRSKYVD